MSRKILGLAALVWLFSFQINRAQIVGERAVGVTVSVGKGCKGFSYRYVFAHHGSLELKLGVSRSFVTDKASSDYGKGFFSTGSTLLGVSYQPFLFPGNRRNGSAVYGNIGIHARIHHNRKAFKFVDPENKTSLWITPDIYVGAGYLWEVFDFLEVFLESDIGYYNPDSGITVSDGNSSYQKNDTYTFYNDVILGFRIRLN